MIQIFYIGEKKKEPDLHHSHPEVEINLFLSGSGYYLVENKKYSVQSGDIFFFLENTFHCLITSNEIKLIKIRFLPGDLNLLNSDNLYYEVMEAYHESSCRLNVKIPSSYKHTAGILNVTMQMWQDYQNSQVVNARQKYLLLYILTSIKDYYAEGRDDQIDRFNLTYYNNIMAAVRYIDEKYSENITISDLAKIAHLSANRFILSFKRFMGMTPIQYVINRRISMACNMVMNNNMSITDIAFESGFKNTANFNKHFKKIVGMTPMEMRKNNQEKEM